MRFLTTVLCVLAVLSGLSQSPPERVTGLPTNELYDLHVDKKGYLWIAHALGISRYDGLHFITYTHPAQVNLRTTDIVEDRHGRIWFHNFSGQVFYIERGRINLLDSYDFKKENQNPRMVICGNELLITSYKGLFVCNTDNFNTRFLPFERTSPTNLVSVSVLHDKAVVFNNLDWYIYQNSRLQKTAAESPFTLPGENFITLQSAAFRDTVFLTANPSGILYKLKLQDNRIRFVARQEYHDYINAVSVNREAWVHTRNGSFNLENGSMIKNADLTSVVKSKEGDTWYSSRRGGLQVSYRPSLWQQFGFRIDREDYIRSLNTHAGYFFAGTQRGSLYLFPTDTVEEKWKLELFNGLGSIDFIRYINNDLFLVGSSTLAYLVNTAEKRIITSLPISAIQDVAFEDNSFYVATAVGLYVIPHLTTPDDKAQWLQRKKKQFPFFKWRENGDDAYLLIPQRSNSVCFDKRRDKLYASTKNGLYEVTKEGARPLRINDREIYSTSIAFKNEKLYISTINDGLWMMNGESVQHFTTANGLSSNTLIRIKLTEDHLWLFEKNGVQVMDIHTSRILPNLDLPKIGGANVLDVAEKDNLGYLSTTEGVFKLPLTTAVPKSFGGSFIDYVIVNGKDTLTYPAARLHHQQNDIQFRFSSPSFYDPESITFHYRLKGAEEEWQTLPSGERSIHYASLTPGDYQFELYAVGSDGQQPSNIIRFPLSIQKPWWRSFWFLGLLTVLVVTAIYLLIHNRVRQKLRMELMRRNISHDLHDDIGATLSSVNLYVDLAQTEKHNTAYLQHIKDNVNYAINHLDDLVWNINPKNDTTEQFIQHMKDYAVPLLKAARVDCHFEYDTKLLQRGLNLQTKRHLYLLFKEMVNNVAKHAHCHHCTIRLQYQHAKLVLSVSDDGQGFEPDKVSTSRNGLSSMQDRAQKLKGTIEINSTPRTGSCLVVTIPV